MRFVPARLERAADVVKPQVTETTETLPTWTWRGHRKKPMVFFWEGFPAEGGNWRKKLGLAMALPWPCHGLGGLEDLFLSF